MHLFLFVQPSRVNWLPVATADAIAIQGSGNCDVSYLRPHPAPLENGAELRIEH